MKYVLMIYGDENVSAKMTEAEQQEEMAEYYAFSAEIDKRGVNRGGEALLPTNTATTVRVRDGKTVTTDGPFAETKEQIGGFYIVDCKDLDEAIEVAALIPGARTGSVEVRPAMVFE